MLPPFYHSVGAGQVIPGLDEGLLTMRVGGIRRLYIPGPLSFPKGLKAAAGRYDCDAYKCIQLCSSKQAEAAVMGQEGGEALHATAVGYLACSAALRWQLAGARCTVYAACAFLLVVTVCG